MLAASNNISSFINVGLDKSEKSKALSNNIGFGADIIFAASINAHTLNLCNTQVSNILLLIELGVSIKVLLRTKIRSLGQ